jgi:hypothetical protein
MPIILTLVFVSKFCLIASDPLPDGKFCPHIKALSQTFLVSFKIAFNEVVITASTSSMYICIRGLCCGASFMVLIAIALIWAMMNLPKASPASGPNAQRFTSITLPERKQYSRFTVLLHTTWL